MSALQEQAAEMIRGLSNEDVKLLIEIMRRWTRQKKSEEQKQADIAKRLESVQRLGNAWTEIRQYFPDDFDPDKELEMARMERYG